MPRPWVISLTLLVGCSSSDFEVPQGTTDASTHDTSTATPDTSEGTDSGPVTVDDGSVPEVIASEACAANKCGGCAVLPKPPGTSCGLCQTSQFECTGPDTTQCKTPDDRTAGTDSYFKSFDSNGVTISGAGTAAAITFSMMRLGSPTSVTLAMQRYDVEPVAEVGTLQVRLIKGTPTPSPASANVLATSLISATLIPATPNTVVILFSSVPLLTKGTQLWLEVTDLSPRANFAVNGAAATGPADLDFYYLSSGSYTRLATTDPYLVVGVKGCF